MSTQVFAQATSTTNDLLAAVPFLIGLIFTLRWWQHRKLSFAVLSGIAFGLALGTKLTMIFFIPATVILFSIKAILIINKKQTFSLRKKEIYQLSIMFLLIAILAAPFMGINYYYAKQLTPKHYNYLLNQPFSFVSAVQTIYTFTTQLIIDPFQYLAITPTCSKEFRQAVEPLIKSALFSGWNRGYAISDLYIFAPDLSEDEVFFGFASILVMCCLLYYLLKSNLRREQSFWLSLVGVGWFVTYCTMTKWSLFNQRYFIGAFLLSMPLIGAFYEQSLTGGRKRKLWIGGSVSFVLITSVLFCFAYIFFNSPRNFINILQPNFDSGNIIISKQMKQILVRQRSVKFVYSGYESENERLYQFMNLSKDQKFYIGETYDEDKYNVFSFWEPSERAMFANIPSSSAFTVMNLPGKKTAGVTRLGQFGEGNLIYHYYGLSGKNMSEDALPANSNIIVRVLFDRFSANKLPLEERLKKLHIEVIGLNPNDNLRLRIYYVSNLDHKRKLAREVSEHYSSIMMIPEAFSGLFFEVVQGDNNNLIATSDILVSQYKPPRGIGVATVVSDSGAIDLDLLDERETGDFKVEGMGVPEGPYPQWDLPIVRWANSSTVRVTVNAGSKKDPDPFKLSLSFRPQIHNNVAMTVFFNGTLYKTYIVKKARKWVDDTLILPVRRGANVLEIQFAGTSDAVLSKDTLYMLFRNFEISSSTTNVLSEPNCYDEDVGLDEDLLDSGPSSEISVEGMRPVEGPYPQWGLPVIRWANHPIVKIIYNTTSKNALVPVQLNMSFRSQGRYKTTMIVYFNKRKLKTYATSEAQLWIDDTLHLIPRKGSNVIEFKIIPETNEPPSKESLYMLFRSLSFKSDKKNE